MPQKFQNFINGQWVDAKSGKTSANRNPANWDDIVGLFPKSGKEDVDEAVKAARASYDKWRLTPAPARGDILRRIGDLLVKHKEEIAHEMTREMGKVLDETRGDVQEGIDTAYYAATEGRRLFGRTVPSELPNKFAMALRVPIGVAGIITPWNYGCLQTGKRYTKDCDDTYSNNDRSGNPGRRRESRPWHRRRSRQCDRNTS